MKQVAIVVTGLMLGAAPTETFAQVLRGSVTDHASEKVISGAQIDLIDDRGGRAAQTTTDTAGFFELRAPGSGSYRLRASMIGYETVSSDVLDLRFREIVEMTVRLSIEPIALTPVVVRIRPDDSRLAEFEERRANNAGGYFITRQDIERRPVATTSELLIGAPGVTLVPQTFAGIPQDRYIITLRGGVGPCTAHVFINGAEVSQSSGSTVDDLLNPEWLGGVEVYPTAAATPVEYRRADCGAVLFWMRDPEGGNRWRWIKVVAAAGFIGLAALITR
jgi:hypothetical protein